VIDVKSKRPNVGTTIFTTVRLNSGQYTLKHKKLLDQNYHPREKAKEYIKNGLSISETCYEVGFESLSSFSSLFKRKTGFTPRTYQKSNFQ